MKKALLFFSVVFFAVNVSLAQSGDKYFKSKDYQNAIRYYEKEVTNTPASYLNLAKSYFAIKEFDKAVEALKLYKEKYAQADKAYADQLITLLERNDDMVKLENMGTAINSSKAEYFPVISQDGKTFYFTGVDRAGGLGGEDIWYSNKKDDGSWDDAKPFSQWNTTSHECLMSISGDGNVAILFGNYEGTFGRGDLFYSVKTAYGWSAPCNLGGAINTEKWETQASLGPDGKTLLFVSDREGSADIYVSTLTENGWTTPINLGPVINTKDGEYGPSLAADGKTLYFNSYGHGGFGGSDIFMAKRLDDSWTNWSKPVNLGKYINSLDDDKYLSIPASGVRAYTVRDDGEGSDIYQFIIPLSMRPEVVFNVYGKVTNEVDSTVAAVIRFVDANTGKEAAKVMSDKRDGMYRVSLAPFKKYNVIIDTKGFLYYTDVVDLTNPDQYVAKQYIQEKMAKEMANIKAIKEKLDSYNLELQKLIDSNSDNVAEAFAQYQKLSDDYRNATYNLETSIYRAKYEWLSEENKQRDIRKDFKLQTIRIGAKFELKNIFFDLGKATLREESKAELNKLYDIMKRSDITIELGGYTDNIGSDEANMVLSQDRVNSVKSFLVGKGLSEGRIAAVGYGEQFPVASNDTEEGRAKNRRVEVKITEIKPREGSEVATNPEEKKKEEAKFDILATLQIAAKNGKLPKGSSCSDKVTYLSNNKTPETKNYNYNNNNNYSPRTSRDNHILKAFNVHLLNFGFKSDVGNYLGAGMNFVNTKLREFHLEYYFHTPDTSRKFGVGGGWLWTAQLNSIGVPLHFVYGIDGSFFDYKAANETKVYSVVNIPVGLRYITKVQDIILGPEFIYSFGLTKPDGTNSGSFMKIGVNARWKAIQGGLFYNAGKLVNYPGFRAGFAF